MNEAAERAGRCLCGAVRFSARIASPEIGACHCSMCRRWSGGPFMGVECGKAVRFESEAGLGWFRSSEWGERGLCTTCGSSLFYRLVESGDYFVSAGAFDDQSGLTLGSEICIDSKPDYYAFAGDAKKMTEAEVFAQFQSGDGGP